MSCGSSHSSLRHLATYAHHGVRSVKQLQITIHFGVLSWALSKCSKLGRTCLLRSVTINSSYMPREFMNSVVAHHLLLFMQVEAVHYYTQVSATNINLRTTYNELYTLSEPKNITQCLRLLLYHKRIKTSIVWLFAYNHSVLVAAETWFLFVQLSIFRFLSLMFHGDEDSGLAERNSVSLGVYRPFGRDYCLRMNGSSWIVEYESNKFLQNVGNHSPKYTPRPQTTLIVDYKGLRNSVSQCT